MSKKAVAAIFVAIMLAAANLACSDGDLKKIQRDYNANVVATQVPMVDTLQKGAEKVNQAVEKAIVAPAVKTVNDAQQQVQSSVAGQAAENAGQAKCITGVLSTGCNGK